jgi:hypothetical protein
LNGDASDNQGNEIRKKRALKRGAKRRSAAGSANSLSNHVDDGAASNDAGFAPPMFAQLTLRQKLALVRRRLGYIQKRGLNEVHSYRYVTAADIAGAVGDILAELGVVVLPRLESISHEPARNGRSEAEHLARVVMAYTFTDVDSRGDNSDGRGRRPGRWRQGAVQGDDRSAQVRPAPVVSARNR